MTKIKYIKHAIIRSWWVIALMLIGSIIYERAIQKREWQLLQLQEQLTSLRIEKQNALHKQQTLQQQINSQNDPAWIELALMKGLGLSPEDQQKVYFFQESKTIDDSP